MPQPQEDVPTDITDDSTRQKRPNTSVVIEPPGKRNTTITRSNNKLVTDFLLEQNRIGSITHTPLKKRRYVQLKSADMLGKLFELYTSLFKQRWSSLGRSVEKFATAGTPAKDHFELCAVVYLSHWTQDLYRMIRESLIALDPVAFNEKYHYQMAVHSQVYDHYLATLTNHLKPTHITLTYADEIYIPLLAKNMDTTSQNVTGWDKFYMNFELFNMILQVFEEKKLVTMTQLSTDLLGRPSWLFDWDLTTAAYAWFPMEANYNDEDVAIAYIIGTACTPKLAHADYDEWKYTKEAPTLTSANVTTYERLQLRRWKASAEFRVAQTESLNYPNIYEKDKTKAAAMNVGPLMFTADPTKKPEAESSSTSTAATSDQEEGEISDSEGEATAFDTPRVTRRSKRATVADENKVHRTRVIDYMYYKQVILRVDKTSRFTAFRMFTKYN